MPHLASTGWPWQGKSWGRMLVSGSAPVRLRVRSSESIILLLLESDRSRTLVHSFPECGLAVALAIDSALYQSDVYVASHGGTAHARSPRKMVKTTWGDRPVLLLLGVRLGIDRVNPVYYDTIKVRRSFFSFASILINLLAVATLYIPPVRRHSRWPSKLFVLFRRRPGQQPLLSRPPPV